MNDFVRSNCQECHNGLKAPALPSFTADWDEWERRIRAADTTALTWLERFNAKVVHGEMLRLAGLKKTSGIGKDFRDFVARQHDRFLGRSREPSGGPLGSSDASFMIDPAKKREYLAALRSANLSDPEIRESLLRFDALWDATGAPLWSWAPKDGDAGRKGQRPVQWTTPAEPPRPHLFQQVDGVWNWKEPFFRGFSKDRHTRGLRSFLAIRFPRDPAGNLIKGILGTETRPRVTSPESSSGYAVKGQADDLDSLWASFPEGTRVFEVIYTTALGEPIAVDVLSRQKRISANGRIAHWVPDSHRHDSSPGKIREWVERQSDWRNDPELRSILDSVNHPVEDVVYSELGTDGTGGHPFLVKGRWTNALTGTKSVVPREAVSRETLLRMYRELPMESALGSPGWQLEPQRVFSRSHRGLPINSNTCANCHDSAGESFEDIFRRAGLDARSVSAYGNGPGYDSVLSAPWFRPEDLKDYGKRVWFDMRPEWAKFFEKYDEGNPKHSARRYRRTENLDVSDHPLRSR